MDQVLQQFRERITSATSSGTALRIRGNGTKDWYGQELNGDVLDTSAYSGIVSYDPTELVVTARAGTTLREIGAALSTAWRLSVASSPAGCPARADRPSDRCATSCLAAC